MNPKYKDYTFFIKTRVLIKLDDEVWKGLERTYKTLTELENSVVIQGTSYIAVEYDIPAKILHINYAIKNGLMNSEAEYLDTLITDLSQLLGHRKFELKKEARDILKIDLGI